MKPATVFNADGTVGDPNGSYWDDINNVPHSMVVLTGAAPTVVTGWSVGIGVG